MYFIIDNTKPQGERATRTLNWQDAHDATHKGHTVINTETMDELSSMRTGFIAVRPIERAPSAAEKKIGE